MIPLMEINLMKMKSTKATRYRHVGVAHSLAMALGRTPRSWFEVN